MIVPALNYENGLWKQGYNFVCGLDEVGRGCFAGPVVVGAVIFPPGGTIPEGIADSKLLKPKVREKLAISIKQQALSYSIAETSVAAINKYGVGKATQMAFRKALRLLSVQADFVLVDAFNVKRLSRKKQKAVIKGDQVCVSIAAASIIAKVYRDELMGKLHYKYPNYGLDKHKGYGTKQHQLALKKYGLSKIHRKSFNLLKFL